LKILIGLEMDSKESGFDTNKTNPFQSIFICWVLSVSLAARS